MAGEGNECTVIMIENVIQQLLQPCILCWVGFSLVWLPELVRLGKARLEDESWKVLLEKGFATSLVACMDSNRFSKQLFDILRHNFDTPWYRVPVAEADLPLSPRL